MNESIDLSVVIFYSSEQKYMGIRSLYDEYQKILKGTNRSFEFIFVITGDVPNVMSELQALIDEGAQFKMIKMTQPFGEAAALNAAFQNSRGKIILNLPAEKQVEESEIPRLIDALSRADMVIARRYPRKDNFFIRLQSKIYHLLIRIVTKMKFYDLNCDLRAFKRTILEKITIYGNQALFLPLFAHQLGFKVIELNVRQAELDYSPMVYPLASYVRRFLDIISVFFLVRFTRKPLRFFGLISLTITLIGVILGIFLFIERNFYGVPMADRPLLLVFILLIVIGVQIFAIGLIAEIIIFTHSKDLEEYVIEKIYDGTERQESGKFKK